MRFPRRYLVGLALIAITPAYAGITLPFDSGWRFLKGDAAAAEQPEFDDGAWRTVNAPHHWAIEGPFDGKNPTGLAAGSVTIEAVGK